MTAFKDYKTIKNKHNKMEEYLLTNDYFYFGLIIGVLVVILIIILVSADLDRFEDAPKLALLWILGLTIIGTTLYISIKTITKSQNEKFITNVWNNLIIRKEVPIIKIISISNESGASRYKVKLINDEVYYVPYETVDYKTIRFTPQVFKSTEKGYSIFN